MANRAPHEWDNKRYGRPRDDNQYRGGHHGQFSPNNGKMYPGNNKSGHHHHSQSRNDCLGDGDRARAKFSLPNNAGRSYINNGQKSKGGANKSGDHQRNNEKRQRGGGSNHHPEIKFQDKKRCKTKEPQFSKEDHHHPGTKFQDNKRYKTEEPQLSKEETNDLTPDQKAYREKFKKQLRFENNIYGIPTQAFCPRVTKEEKEEAANYALAKAVERRAMQRKEAASNRCCSDSSDSDDCPVPGATSCTTDKFELTTGQKQFFRKLKDCLPLTTGFDIEGSPNIRHCYCPCGKDLQKWREEDHQNVLNGQTHADPKAALAVAMLIDEDDLKKSPCRSFEPMGLMQHLETEGERCILHYGTRKYLEKLYENFNGPGIGHRCLYKMGDRKYREADAKQTRNLQKLIQVEKAKNRQMERRLATLEKVSEDLYKRKEMLEEWRIVLRVQEKQKRNISDPELSSYRLLMEAYMFSLKAKHAKKGDVRMTVRGSPPPSKTSFSLQNFFDYYYDEDPRLKDLAAKPSATASQKRKAAKEVADTRGVLFGDHDETGYVAHAILSTWKITFKERADQEEESTAVDEGGPLKQFKTDCWKQLNNLSIPVGGRMVRLFEDGEGGVMPVPDDVLEHRMKLAVKSNEEEIESALKRAESYMRAVGRLMFNSFHDRFFAKHGKEFDEHLVPRSTMLSIFANLILRGCIPGDDSYERDDVLKHIVPLFPNPEKNLIKHHIGEKVDETDDNSPLWTPDLIFKKLLPDVFIHSRSLLLGALEDGLSLSGREKSSKLEQGSGLAAAFRAIPLDALQKILFGKSTITAEEVMSALVPDYGKCEGDWEGGDEQLIEEKQEQEKFFNGDFKKYISDEATKNSAFLEEFVQFCTGSNYIPFQSPGEKKFKITVEFNFTEPTPGSHPMAHTCVNTIRLPGTGIYYGNYDLFCEKMNEALAQCNRFDME